MRKACRFLSAVAGLLLCLLASPALAAAQRDLSPAILDEVHVGASEGGETEVAQEELSDGEEGALVTTSEAEEEEGEEAESEESEQSLTAATHRHGPRCVVPSLQGESLSGARAALSRAHCKLGKVSEPHAHHGGLVIVAQSQLSGKRLLGGASIAVRMSAGAGKGHHRR